MKKLVFLVFITLSQTLMAQNVGIGISNPQATLDVGRGTPSSVTANFRGSTHISHFNFGTDEDTYIRAGKNDRNVILNDIPGGRVGIGTSDPLQKLHVEGTTYLTGNTGIGTYSPSARLSISAIGTELAGTAASNTLRTNAGTLGITADSEISLASFGFLSTSNSSLGIRAYRTSGGTDWTSTALVFGYDVDNTVRAGGAHFALSANGNIGIGTVTPLQKLHVQGTTFLNGNVGIGTSTPGYPLDVTSNTFRTGNFVNTSISLDHYGLFGSCATTPNYGIGLFGYGGHIGVNGESNLTGPGNRLGVSGSASNGPESNYGLYGIAVGGQHAYGVYASATGGVASTWAGYFTGGVFATASPTIAGNLAGYFAGNVYTTGTYYPSDSKLKNEIIPLSGALSIINQLNPSFYTFKTTEYKQMQLPEGIHYGLIADEVLQVVPGIVKKTIQPAHYENHNGHTGKKLNDEVEFNAVNYTEMIPILIGAVKEQQSIINNLQKQIDELKKPARN